MITFQSSSQAAMTTSPSQKVLDGATPKFNRRFVGIGRPIRMAMVAAALREAGVSSPRVLPISVTRR